MHWLWAGEYKALHRPQLLTHQGLRVAEGINSKTKGTLGKGVGQSQLSLLSPLLPSQP